MRAPIGAELNDYDGIRDLQLSAAQHGTMFVHGRTGKYFFVEEVEALIGCEEAIYLRFNANEPDELTEGRRSVWSRLVFTLEADLSIYLRKSCNTHCATSELTCPAGEALPFRWPFKVERFLFAER